MMIAIAFLAAMWLLYSVFGAWFMGAYALLLAVLWGGVYLRWSRLPPKNEKMSFGR